ncbi:MAG: sigma-54-dependent Fis family transcriptional regulator [Phycisphaerales bacterium]|nr:sigma-54-dependent Fis family transcriptional regulator [Phycisphaerales bacterium]
MGSEKPRILIIDDDRIILDSLCELLRLEGYEVEGATKLATGMAALARGAFHVAISDINMPGGDGFELLRTLRQRWPQTVVIMITGYGTIESAVEAIKLGAYDYLTKPIIDDEIRLVVERALHQQALIQENQTLKKRLEERYGLDSIVGHDHQMQKVYDLIEAVAPSKVTVLVQGESGTGKSLVARVIHHRSHRADKPLVEVACGAIPESLLESELFGHVKGAFTGAVADKVGKFKAADGGTLFLDEIATASPALQVKLLRAVQEMQFEPVGSYKTEKVDVRLVLATNKDLESEVRAGNFREDLYYRINVVNINLPPLCERLGDIPLLAGRFLVKYVTESGRPIDGFTEDALGCMQRYHWPGNVRELENVVERAVVLARGRQIDVDDLPPKLIEQASTVRYDVTFAPTSLKKALEGPEKAVIEAALRANGWNRQATAETLEINRTTLYKKMKRYGLEGETAGRR